MLAILGALEQEIGEIRALLERPRQLRVGHLDLHRGRMHGQTVLLARCGVGKVNAALAVAALQAAGATQVLFTGVGGGVAPGLRVGDLVVADDLVQHDVDLTALGRPPGQLMFEPGSWSADPVLRQRLEQACRRVAAGAAQGPTVHVGVIASGDQFVASRERADAIRDEFGALCVEMEGAALAQAATAFGMPFAVVRVLSDTADQGAAADFPAFLDLSAGVTARIVTCFLTES